MPIALAVLAINAIHRVLHLGHILRRAAIKRLLHHRLLGTLPSSKGQLQGRICSQARVDLDHAMGPRKPGDEAVIELVGRHARFTVAV